MAGLVLRPVSFLPFFLGRAGRSCRSWFELGLRQPPPKTRVLLGLALHGGRPTLFQRLRPRFDVQERHGPADCARGADPAEYPGPATCNRLWIRRIERHTRARFPAAVRPRIVAFLGRDDSENFHSVFFLLAARRVLREISPPARSEGYLLNGHRLVQDPAGSCGPGLYDETQRAVTAEFNRNVLRVLKPRSWTGRLRGQRTSTTSRCSTARGGGAREWIREWRLAGRCAGEGTRPTWATSGPARAFRRREEMPRKISAKFHPGGGERATARAARSGARAWVTGPGRPVPTERGFSRLATDGRQGGHHRRIGFSPDENRGSESHLSSAAPRGMGRATVRALHAAPPRTVDDCRNGQRRKGGALSDGAGVTSSPCGRAAFEGVGSGAGPRGGGGKGAGSDGELAASPSLAPVPGLASAEDRRLQRARHPLDAREDDHSRSNP